jgi:exonuclease III
VSTRSLLQCGDIQPNPGPVDLHDKINCLSLNAQSMKAIDKKKDKLADFKAMTDLLDPDIFTITESWLTENIEDKSLTTTDDYKIFRKDREHTIGGGVLCLVKRNITSKRRDDLESTDIYHNEIIAVEIKPVSGERFLIISAYRSQTDPSLVFLKNLETILTNAAKEDIYNFLILGDLNYREIKWTDNENRQGLPPHCRDLLSLLNRWNLHQLNHHPS